MKIEKAKVEVTLSNEEMETLKAAEKILSSVAAAIANVRDGDLKDAKYRLSAQGSFILQAIIGQDNLEKQPCPAKDPECTHPTQNEETPEAAENKKDPEPNPEPEAEGKQDSKPSDDTDATDEKIDRFLHDLIMHLSEQPKTVQHRSQISRDELAQGLNMLTDLALGGVHDDADLWKFAQALGR